MTVLATILGLSLLSWGLRRLVRPQAPGTAPQPVPDDSDVSRLREQFATTDMSVEEFEAEVAGELERASHPPAAPVYTSRTEIHVYDAPPGHQLHIHLP